MKGNGFAAARFEEMKRAQQDGRTTPDEDARFREVTEMLQVLTKRLGLGDTITGWNEFLPGDPQRLMSDSWLSSARRWFQCLIPGSSRSSRTGVGQLIV